MEGGRHSPRTNVLPKGEVPIRLPSEECEEKFHNVTSKTEVPLLDDHSAKYREVESKFTSQGTMKPQILPTDHTSIPLQSAQCEEKFHVTSTTEVLLLNE